MPNPNATPTPITPPRVPLIDSRTGLIDRAWYMFFLSLMNAAMLVYDGDVKPNSESLLASYDAALQSLAQNVNTQPLPVDLSAELTKQIEAAGLTNYATNLLSQVAEMQKQLEALNLLPQPTQGALTNGTSILYGDGSGGFSNVSTGSGVSFVAGVLSATGSGGTITSVTATAPIASSGGFTPNISINAAYGDTINPYAAKTANYVLAGPTSGAAAVPTFRALVAGDIPSLSYVTSVAASVPSFLSISGSPITTSGTLAIGLSGTALPTTSGGTGLTSFTANGVVYASSTSALATSSTFVFNGTSVGLGTTSPTGRMTISESNRVIDGIGNFNVFTTNSQAANLGGQIALGGLNGSAGAFDPWSFANVKGAKENGTSGNFSGYLALATANSGGTITERVRVASTGTVTMNAYGVGTATFSAAGVISSVSDETWKIQDGAPTDTDAMLKKLVPGYWYYNEEKSKTFGKERQLGFYAQNVNAAIGPEAAPEPEEGKPWGYYDRSVLAVVVMSLKKALDTIDSLTARIAALEQK